MILKTQLILLLHQTKVANQILRTLGLLLRQEVPRGHQLGKPMEENLDGWLARAVADSRKPIDSVGDHVGQV